MINTAQKPIESFDSLPETEQHEVLAQLIHCLIYSPSAPLPDEDFTQAADLIYQEFDRTEAPGCETVGRVSGFIA